MSPESTRGWDIRLRSWVRHPSADALSQSVAYQVLPPNGAVAALAWRSRGQQPERGDRARPLVSRVLVGNTSLLTPEAAIALCRMGLPATAGERPGQVAAGTELPTLSGAEVDALVSGAMQWLDREAREAAGGDGLAEVIAAAVADPNAPLAISLPQPAVARLPGDGAQARLLWGLWRISRPLLGTVRRGWSFSTFELPPGASEGAAVPDVVFRSDTGEEAAGGGRKEILAIPGDPGELAGSPQAWLAQWLVAEYQQGGAEAVEQLVAECGVEQPLQARLAAVYDILHARWARRAVPVAPAGPDGGPRADAEAVLSQESGRGQEARRGREAGPSPEAEAGLEAERALDDAEVLETGLALDPGPDADEDAGGYWADDGWTDDDWAEPEPEPDHRPGGPRPAPPGQPPRLFEAAMARSLPDLLARLAGTGDAAEFKLLLQDILTIGAEPELGNRVDARRMLFEANWCIADARPADRELHADELARIFQVIVLPDLDRPRVGRELAEWALVAPPAVIGGLLAAARGQARGDRRGDGRDGGHGDPPADRSVPEKYLAMVTIIQPVLAQRWLEASGLGAEWDPRLMARSRRGGRGPESGRGFLGFRKRG
jgi:hypothetical protein